MPIYEYVCKHNHVTDELFKYPPPDSVKCAVNKCRCNSHRRVSMPAKTSALWGDSVFGINGTFNRGLGTHITSRKQEDAICKERGLVREADLQTHWHTDNNKRLQDDKAALDKISNDYHAAVLSHGDDPERFVKACTEVFPAHQMLEEAHQHELKGSLDTPTPTGI